MESITTNNGRSLNAILSAHAQWVDGVATAFRCILDGETLNGAELQDANFRRAIIRRTTLLDADLS
ncbi:MAG: pentapeptide repeat-containing protein, partial [Acidobacteriia bacterium]|nr:pentapeptide repeat-containing protein [Terriglobia bacterium]